VYGFREHLHEQNVDMGDDADYENDGIFADDTDNDFSIPNGDQPVFEGSRMSKGQLLTVVFAFILRHCCTETAVCDLLLLLNSLIPGCVPRTLYYFRKFLSKLDSDLIETHAYCNLCGSYLAVVSADGVKKTCTECDELLDCDEMVKKGCFFLLFPLKKQLQTLLELNSVSEQLMVNSSCLHNNYCDIRFGTEYQKLNVQFPEFLTVTCNTDGVPVFSSGNASLWPIYFVINELPLRLRSVHMMLNALWFGQSHPRMDTYFTPVVEELQTLFDEGFTWLFNGKSYVTKVIMCLCSCDSVARPLLQNLKQFNGQYGCGYCLHPGCVVSKGQGNVRVYMESVDEQFSSRTHDNILEHAEMAISKNEPVFGVKGPTMLSLIPSFDLVKGFFPDYMHSVLLGVVRQMISLWFDSSNHSKPFYLGRHVQHIDRLLLAIKPPSEVKRLPRSVTARKYWKASEFRNFLLFYSPICLNHFLPKVYLHHWYLLFFAVHNLMRKGISSDKVLQCDLALHKFVVDIAELYGPEHVTYNVHLMTHLATSVDWWGPLWANSAFLFEDANGKLLTFFHGMRGLSKQIFRSFTSAARLRVMAAKYVDGSCLSLYEKFTNSSFVCKRGVTITDDLIGLGKPIERQLTAAERAAVLNLFPAMHLCSCQAVEFKRVLVNNHHLLRSKIHSCAVRNCDSCIELKCCKEPVQLCSMVNVQLCSAVNCTSHTVEEKFLFLVNVFSESTSGQVCDGDIGANLLEQFRKVELNQDELVAFDGDSFSRKLFVMSDDTEQGFLIKVPVFELD
jgi:hypothetical protein